MAYTPAPENQTYASHRISAAYPIQLRPGSASVAATPTVVNQDAGMVNLLPIKANSLEKTDTIFTAETRPTIYSNGITSSGVSSVVRGAYVWEKSAGTVYYFMVCGTGVYTTTTPETASSWTLVTTLTTNATTPVRFTEFISDIAVKKLILVDGVEGYVFTSNAAGTKITDADFPTPHVPWPVFIDGYIFLAKAGTGDIYNSDLNAPETWTAGSFISSELYPDDVQAIVKVNNYLLAIGTQGCEYFYDAANPTASPLARYEGGSLAFGCQLPNSIAVNKNTVVFLSNNNDGQTVLKIIEDFKHIDINTSFVVPILDSRIKNSATYSSSGAACRGYFFRQSGKLYYGLRLEGATTTVAGLTSSNIPTFVLSLETQAWTEFRFGSDGSEAFPVICTATTSTGNLSTYVAGFSISSSTVKAFFGRFLEGETSANAAQDVTPGSSPYVYQEIRTPNLDFDTLNLKSMHRFGIIAGTGNSTTSNVTFSVSWNDYDYNSSSWTTARTLTQTAGSFVFPFLTQLGMFRRRAFKILNNTGNFLRVEGFEFDINKGQQ
jgi:hypothetical protein